MDSTFIWILMFAGVLVAWLGVLLVTSERELRSRRREIEALLAKLENAPQGAIPAQPLQSDTDPAALTRLQNENQNLQRELSAMTSELDRSRASIVELRNSQQQSAITQGDQQSLTAANERLQSEIDDLRAALRQSHAKIQDFESARQNQPDMSAIAAGYNQERNTLQQRIAELETRLSMEQEKLAELQPLRDRLDQAQRVEASLRDEIRRHEAEIPRWQARIAAGEETRRRMAALQTPCDGLLSKQAALADRQRQLQEELVAFARQVAAAVEGNGETSPTANVSPGAASATEPLYETETAPSDASGRRFGALGMLLLIAGAGLV